MGIELEPGEQQLGKWIINFRPEKGGLVGGNLVVTDSRILYEPKTNIGLSTLLVDITYKGVITVPKSEVTDVSVEKSFLSKKVHVTLANGERLTFDNGAMSIDKVEAAIRA
jgi:hypothetical protein